MSHELKSFLICFNNAGVFSIFVHLNKFSFGCLFRERQGSFGYCGTMCADSLTCFSDINS